MKIKIIFYGIGRGLDICLPSIEKNLIDAVKEFFKSIEVFHLIQVEKEISNQRSGDFGFMPEIPEKTFKDTQPILINFKPEVDAKTLYKKIINSKCMHGDEHKSSINLIKQLNLLKNNNIDISDDDMVIFCRDDIYIEFLDINILKKAKKLKSNEFIVSCYDWHNGISDRFLIAKGKTAKIFKNRLNQIEELISVDGGINGERLVRYISEIYNLQPISFNIKFRRVRLNHSLVKEKRWFPLHRPNELIRLIKSFIKSKQLAIRK